MRLKQFIFALTAMLLSFVSVNAQEGIVAKIGNSEYTTFANAMTDANAATGNVTVMVYGTVEFVDGMELNGSYTSITFTGKSSGAQITINQTAGGDYLTAHGKIVAFENLILAKANPAWSGNSGHMGNYFSVQGGTVTYTDCTFPNGACTNTGTAVYNNCTFQNASEYGLWVYDDALVTVNGGTIDSTKGIKVYSEGEESVTSTLTVQNATFTENVTAKPAVAIGYAESITLIGNTYNNTTGHVELDSGSDADCDGIAFVAEDSEGNDISSELTVVDRSKSSAACGVLVDGKIYTTVTTAAAEATSGSTVTLLYSTTETVELPEGVTLDTNGFTADNVTVEVSLAGEGTEVSPYLISSVADLETLRNKVNAGNSYAGQFVKLAADLTLTEAWTPIGNGTRSSKSYSGNAFKGTFDGDNKTISGLKITSTTGDDAAIGLFGVVDGGAVKNLTLNNVDINVANSDLAGGAIGLMLGGATAGNITVNGAIVGNDGVGGIVGRLVISGTIENCTNNASVTSSYGGIGGIVGKAYYEDSANTVIFASIDNCTNNGTVTAPMYVGGIAGLARANVTGCVNNGAVVGGTQTGGIIGQLIAAGTVSGNENKAKITGKNHMGGIIGDYTQSSAYTYNNVAITSNINRGELAATEQCAAIMGCNNIDGFTAMTATGNVSYYFVEGLELFGNPEDMVIDDTNKFISPVAKIGDVEYETLAEAVAAAQAGDEIVLLGDVAEDATLPAGVKFNGNGKAVGNLIAGGEITFTGVTKATSFNVENTNTTVNIVAGACLEITGTGRMVIGHGCTFNITGNIENAKTADVAALTPSLIMPGASFTGAGVTFNVTNAYISAPSSYCSSSKSASGTFDFNITNSIWESAGKLAFESQSVDATVDFDLKNSVLNTGSHLVFGVSRGEIVIDNSNVNVGTARQIENQSTMTIKNGSVVNGAVATSSNAKNPGTLIVENATYAVTGEFSGSDLGTGTIIVKKGATVSAGSITKANIQIDATGMAAGDVINLTANLSNLAGSLTVVNNDNLDASIVDGKIVLAVKPVAKIGETKYATLAEAIAAIGAGDVVIELLADVTFDYNARDAYGTAETTSVTINGNGQTLTLNQKDSDWASIGLANAAGKLVLNDMTIEKTGYGDTNGAWNTHAIIFSCPVEMNDVTVNQSMAVQAGATLNNVTINEANGYYGLWINGNGQSVTVNGGAINATNGGRGIKIADEYIEAPAQVTLNVTGTKFTTAKKAAVLVSSTAGANITASDVDIADVAEDSVNFVWVDEDWAAYYNNIKVYDEATKAQENEESFPIKVWYVNGEGVASSVRAYFKNLDDLFAAPATQVPGSNRIELRGNVAAANKVNVSYGSNRVYSFVTDVAEGVTMTFNYVDNWNMLPKFNLGKNITMNVKYLQVIGGDIEIAGNLVTDYLYLYGTGEGVTITETGVVTANTGDATVQVKGGTVLTVNGKLTTSTLNVWTQDVNNSELIVSGANAQVTVAHLHAWNGKDGVSAQKVNVENGATLTATNFQADRGSEVAVADATVNSDAITLGYGNNIGKLTETGNSTINGPINLNSTVATVVSDGGLNVTTAIEGYKVVYDAENKMYKVVAIGDLYASIGENYYESLEAALDVAVVGDVITFLQDITEDVTISQSVTIDGAGKKYTGTMTGNAGLTVTVQNVNFVNGGFDKSTKSTTGNYTFKDCTFVDNGTYAYPLLFKGASNINVEGCTVNGYMYGFLYVTSGTNAVSVKNVTVENCPSYAVYFASGVNSATFESLTVKNSNNGFVINNTATRAFTIKDCTMENVNTAINHSKGTNAITCTALGVNDFGEAALSEYAVINGATITGTTYYGSVKGMVEKAVTGQTVQLLSDITLDATGYEMATCDEYPSFVHVEGKAITVDLNGKTIDANVAADDVSNFVVGVFSTDNGGELTLVDNSAEGTGTVKLEADEGKVYSLLCNYEDGCKITINGGTYKANNVRDCLVYSGGKTDAIVTVNGGNFTLGNVGAGENGKPWIFNVLGAGDHHVLVNGGTFNADINRQHWSNEVYVAKECYTVANTDGTYTVKEGAVAYVNMGMLTGPYFVRKNVGYATLGEAFAAADDDETVTLLKDITYTKETGFINGEYVDGLVYTGDKNFTVDFAGHTVTENGDINDYLVYLKNTGENDNEITFKNGTIAINSQSTATAWAAITVGSNSSTHATTLNLDSMKVINGNPNAAANLVIRSRNGATVNLNEGTTVTSNGTSYGVVAEAASTLNINDGAKVIQQNSGTTGGNTVYTAVSGNGVINIYDGAVIESDKYGIHNMTTGNTEINIYGGTITAPVIVRAATNGGSGESADVYISGGTFYGAMEEYTNTANIHVSDGVFDRPVAEEFCAEGYAPCDNADGTYGVYYAVLDEVHFVDGEFTEYNNSRNMTVGTLTYERSSIPTTWTPFYVPFEVPVSQLAEQGFEVAYINGVRRDDDNYDGELDDFVMEVIYIHGGNADGSTKTLKANYPYFIRSKGSERIDLYIELEDALLYAAKNATYDCSTFTEKFEITGNASQIEINSTADALVYGVSGGGWTNITTGATLKPFRFYMTLTSRDGSAPVTTAASLSIVVRGEELPDGTTLIYDINAETGDNVIYDLNGRRVLETEKGNIYIINGKKVLVK